MPIDILAAGGARVDRDALTARLPWALVEECLARVPRDILLAARDPERDVRITDGALVTTSDGTATYIMDDRTGERLEGTAEALARVMRLFDALPEIDFLWPSLSARDLDPVTANLEIEAISLRNSTKHIQDEVRSPEYVEPLVEILEAIAGASLWERPIFSTINCTVAPLQHDRHMTEASIGLARAGVPILDPADGAHGHDGADEHAEHDDRQHGRAALGGRALRTCRARAARSTRASVRRRPTCAPASISAAVPRPC